MRRYKLCIQIIIIIIIFLKKIIKVKWDGRSDGCGESVGRREIFFLFTFILFASLLDLRKSDRRFLSEQKAKLDYATRVTRRYQYLSVSSNFKR